MDTTLLITAIATFAAGVLVAGFSAPRRLRRRWGARGLVGWWAAGLIWAAVGTGVGLLAYYPFRWLMVFLFRDLYGESPLYGVVFGAIMGATLGLIVTGYLSWEIGQLVQGRAKPGPGR